MYRKRTKCSRKLENMRKARERKRMETDPPEYPAPLPDLRREVIVIDHDFGTVVEHMQLYRSRRIDCYQIVVDGKQYGQPMGWAECLELVRKSFLRVSAAGGHP